MKFENDFAKYAADALNARLKELGMSKYRLFKETGLTNAPTLRRILKAEGSTNITTLAHYCGLLGLEIKIQPKEQKDEI